MTRPARLDALLLLGLFVGALALRLHNLGLQPLWLDEAYTWHRAALPIAETISETIARHHVPPYFVFMHYWIALGDDEFMLRFPSAIAGALAVCATYMFGRVLASRGVGLVAAACMLLTPLQLRYSQEARMYSMMTFTVAVCLCGFFWLGTHLPAASRPILGTARLRKQPVEGSQSTDARGAQAAWTAYGLGLLGTLYLHNTGVFLGATVCVAFLALLVGAQGTRVPLILNFLAANAVVVAVWALYLGTAITQAQTVGERFWAEYPSTAAVLNIGRELYAFNTYDRKAWYAVGALACAGVFALRRTPHLAVALVVCVFGAPLVDLAVSLHTPMFMPRLILWATVPGSVLLALGANSVRHWLAPLVVTLYFAHLAQPGLHTILETRYKPLWRETARLIEQRAKPGAAILAPQRQPDVLMRYYFQRKKLPVGDVPVITMPVGRLKRGVRDQRELWVVDSVRKSQAAKYVKALQRMGGRITYRHVFGGKIEVQRIELPGKASRGRT